MQLSAQSSELKDFIERPLEHEPSPELLLHVVRLKIKDNSLSHRAIFELSYYSPISCIELINFNPSDIDVEMRTVKLKEVMKQFLFP